MAKKQDHSKEKNELLRKAQRLVFAKCGKDQIKKGSMLYALLFIV